MTLIETITADDDSGRTAQLHRDGHGDVVVSFGWMESTGYGGKHLRLRHYRGTRDYKRESTARRMATKWAQVGA